MKENKIMRKIKNKFNDPRFLDNLLKVALFAVGFEVGVIFGIEWERA